MQTQSISSGSWVKSHPNLFVYHILYAISRTNGVFCDFSFRGVSLLQKTRGSQPKLRELKKNVALAHKASKVAPESGGDEKSCNRRDI